MEDLSSTEQSADEIHAMWLKAQGPFVRLTTNVFMNLGSGETFFSILKLSINEPQKWFCYSSSPAISSKTDFMSAYVGPSNNGCL